MKKPVLLSAFCVALFSAALAFSQDEAIKLFEKKNPGEWAFHAAQEGVSVNDVFAFDGDTLTCKGQPFGYLATKERYKNFNLTVEYRWPEGVKPTNSGLFLRMTDQPEKTFLPKCFEVQLQHGNAGDFWGFHGRNMTAPAQSDPRRFIAKDGGAIAGAQKGVKRLFRAENEPGRWNKVDVLCNEGLVVIVVNGKIVNWITDAEVVDGAIGFQSEGGPIEFRHASLTVLP